MNIWTIKQGETLPLKGSAGRIMRTGLISEMLANRGHKVTYFSSDFSHHEKRRIADGPVSISINKNYEVFLLHAKTPYYKHISLQRLIHHRQLGKALYEEFQKRKKPDAIYVCFPIPEFCEAALRYGKENNVPVIVDIRDIWPDVMINLASDKIKPFVKASLKGLDKRTEKIVKDADVLVGTSPSFLKWANNKGRVKTKYDGVMYLAYDNKVNEIEEINKAKAFCDNLGISKNNNNFCYIGHGGKLEELSFLKDALDKLNEKNADVNIIICGEGDRTAYWKKIFKPYKNVIFTGFVNKAYLSEIMDRSVAGLVFYLKERFCDNITNKPIEYMSHGLPALSSLEGDLAELYRENNIGFTYKTGKELAEQMIRLIEDKDLTNEMSKNAKKLFESNFTIEKVYGSFCDKLESIVEANE